VIYRLCDCDATYIAMLVLCVLMCAYVCLCVLMCGYV
jgi:hypothetical protein